MTEYIQIYTDYTTELCIHKNTQAPEIYSCPQRGQIVQAICV